MLAKQSPTISMPDLARGALSPSRRAFRIRRACNTSSIAPARNSDRSTFWSAMRRPIPIMVRWRVCRRHGQAVARPRHAVGDRQRAVDLPHRRGPVHRLPDRQGRGLPARRRGRWRRDAQAAQPAAPRRAEDRRHRKTACPACDDDARVEPAAAIRHRGTGRRGQGAFRALLHRLPRGQRDRQRLHPRPPRLSAYASFPTATCSKP